VVCKVAKPRREVTCTVRFASAAGRTTVSARLRRGRTVYATAAPRSVGASATLRLRARRQLKTGVYALTLRFQDAGQPARNTTVRVSIS